MEEDGPARVLYEPKEFKVTMKELSLYEIQQEITRWGLHQFGDQNRSAYVGDPSCGTPMGSLIQLCGVATEVSEAPDDFDPEVEAGREYLGEPYNEK